MCEVDLVIAAATLGGVDLAIAAATLGGGLSNIASWYVAKPSSLSLSSSIALRLQNGPGQSSKLSRSVCGLCVGSACLIFWVVLCARLVGAGKS